MSDGERHTDSARDTTPRRGAVGLHSVVPTLDQVRGSLRLDRDPIKFIAAKRTPRRGERSLDAVDADERDRIRDLEARRRRLQRVQEATGVAPTVDDVAEDAELEAVLHLPEHHYDRHALARFQAQNDAALLRADVAQMNIDGSKGAKAAFLFEHYDCHGLNKVSPRVVTNRSPTTKRKPPVHLPKIQLKDPAVKLGRMDSTHTPRLGEGDHRESSQGTARNNKRLDEGSPDAKTAAKGRRPSQAAGGGTAAQAMVPDEQVFAWLQEHQDEPPHMWRRYVELDRQKQFCTLMVDDIFARARDFFVTQEPVDPWFGKAEPASTVSRSFVRRGASSSGVNQQQYGSYGGEAAVLSIVSSGDFVFAIDPRVADLVTPDFVREIMEQVGIDVVFLSPDEAQQALGAIAYDVWLNAVNELAAETKLRKGASDTTGPSQPTHDRDVHARQAAKAGHTAVSEHQQMIDDGPITFVIRRVGQSNAAEMRKLQRKLTAGLAAVFDSQMQSLLEEAVSSILLAEVSANTTS